MSAITFKSATAPLVAAKRTTSPKARTSLRVTATAAKTDDTPAKVEFCAGQAGSSAPLPNFDPMNFMKGASTNKAKLFREAELTHGRVAMVASLGFVTAENFNPFFSETIKGPAIGHFQQLPSTFWAVILAGIGITEFTRLTKGWVNPAEGKGLWTLREDYLPGSIGWDPLGLKPDTPAEFEKMQLKELNNGRLAMFGIAGMVAQELVTGKELFNLEADGLLNDANCPPGIICEILETSAGEVGEGAGAVLSF